MLLFHISIKFFPNQKKKLNPWVLHLWIGSTKKNKSVEPNDCCFLIISSILCRVLTCVYIWIGWLLASELSLISSKTFPLPPAHSCEEVDRGRLAYAAICDNSDCFGSTLLFFFVEPIHRWSTHGFNFFNFESILYWYKIKVLLHGCRTSTI